MSQETPQETELRQLRAILDLHEELASYKAESLRKKLTHATNQMAQAQAALAEVLAHLQTRPTGNGR